MDLDLDEALAEEEEPKSYDEFKKGRSVKQVRNNNLFELIKGNLKFVVFRSMCDLLSDLNVNNKT